MIELGCGHALPGIAVLMRLGAGSRQPHPTRLRLYLVDHDEFVLRDVTLPNLTRAVTAAEAGRLANGGSEAHNRPPGGLSAVDDDNDNLEEQEDEKEEAAAVAGASSCSVHMGAGDWMELYQQLLKLRPVRSAAAGSQASDRQARRAKKREQQPPCCRATSCSSSCCSLASPAARRMLRPRFGV